MMNHVLVVKEDLQWRELLQETLPPEGFWVTGVKSVDDALTQVIDIAPDLIVLDIEAPKSSAIEMCRQLQVSRAIPIVVCTSSHEATHLDSEVTPGTPAWLQKPIVTEQLIAVLHQLSA
jgi:CheY-like chemotaxis protein